MLTDHPHIYQWMWSATPHRLSVFADPRQEWWLSWPGDVCVCSEHERFVQLSLRLLSIHLSMALARGVTSAAVAVVGSQAAPLRNLLFRLMDVNLPHSIQQVLLAHTLLSFKWPLLSVDVSVCLSVCPQLWCQMSRKQWFRGWQMNFASYMESTRSPVQGLFCYYLNSSRYFNISVSVFFVSMNLTL